MKYIILEETAIEQTGLILPATLIELDGPIDFTEATGRPLESKYILFIKKENPVDYVNKQGEQVNSTVINISVYPSNLKKEKLTERPVVIYKGATMEEAISLFTENKLPEEDLENLDPQEQEVNDLYNKLKLAINRYPADHRLGPCFMYLETSELWFCKYLSERDKPPVFEVNVILGKPPKEHKEGCPNAKKKGVH